MTTTTPPPVPATASSTHDAEREAVALLIAGRAKIEDELSKIIVGQKKVIEQILIALFAGGHCLITGAPGLAKTLLIKCIAQVFHLKFQRIQFTPDLMPADITGTEILQETGEGRKMTFVRGPVFANMVLADEMNRTPPKTQAALVEAMQEHQVTAAGFRHVLEEPFFVLATQNPIEMEGTYPLPEAQLDRFLLKLRVKYPSAGELAEIVDRTTKAQTEAVQKVAAGPDVETMKALVREVPIAQPVKEYVTQLVLATRPRQAGSPGFINDWVSWGAGTRAGQSLVLGAKARALMRGRYHVSYEDIRAMYIPV